mgnify:CR=1 FL=1
MPSEIIVMSMAGTTTEVAMQIEVQSKEAMAKVVQQFRYFETVAKVINNGYQAEIDDDGNETVKFSVTLQYGQNPNVTKAE